MKLLVSSSAFNCCQKRTGGELRMQINLFSLLSVVERRTDNRSPLTMSKKISKRFQKHEKVQTIEGNKVCEHDIQNFHWKDFCCAVAQYCLQSMYLELSVTRSNRFIKNRLALQLLIPQKYISNTKLCCAL